MRGGLKAALIGGTFGSGIVAMLTDAVGAPEATAAFGALGLISASAAIVVTARSSPGRPAPKPDYQRIAELEQELFDRTFVHDGAPVAAPKLPNPPLPPPFPAMPAFSHTFYIQASGVTASAQVQIGGAGSVNIQAGGSVSVPDELKVLMNWPRCPACGTFSEGSTGSPDLCARCRKVLETIASKYDRP